MKIVNHTGHILNLYIGKEGSDAAEIHVEFKVNEEIKIGEDDGMLYVFTS